jgi:hypothetical protein
MSGFLKKLLWMKHVSCTEISEFASSKPLKLRVFLPFLSFYNRAFNPPLDNSKLKYYIIDYRLMRED